MIRLAVIAVALAGCAATPSGNSPLPMQQTFTPAPAYAPFQLVNTVPQFQPMHRTQTTTCSPGFSGSMNCVSW